jgi:hypothetical protein
MKKITLSAIIIISSVISVQAQTLNPTSVINTPNSANNFKGGYTFSYTEAGTPWNGALISFGGAGNGYDCQISSDYGPNGGNHISFRTHNGDPSSNNWNSWNEIWHSGNLNNINSDFTARTITSSKININGDMSNPSLLLDVNGKASVKSLFYVNDIMGGDGGDIRMGPNTGGNASTIFMVGGVNPTEIMRISYNQNVGIGTTNPDEKLTVNGKIHAKEVKIDLNFPAPDYVFANTYKLKSLQEVEEFIKQNSHLPEIPSAKEIEKNGLMLAEMNMSLLKKIEELTLYSIEQNKKILLIEKQNEKLQKENEGFKSLSERLSKIENQLK